MKERVCCFTGHRPQRFHFGYDEEHEDCIRLKAVLAKEIKNVLDGGITVFYTGMAIGTDLWSAKIVQAFQENFSALGIKLIAAIPFEGQADKWSSDYRERYFNILAKAEDAIILHARYTKACMYERNCYMDDHSTHLIAVYNGSAGRTRNTLEYAKKKNLACIVINPEKQEPEREIPLRSFILLK